MKVLIHDLNKNVLTQAFKVINSSPETRTLSLVLVDTSVSGNIETRFITSLFRYFFMTDVEAEQVLLKSNKDK